MNSSSWSRAGGQWSYWRRLIFCWRHRKGSGNMQNLDATRKSKIFQPVTVGLHLYGLRRGEGW